MHVPQTEVVLRHDGAELARITLPPGEYVIGRSADAAIHADTPLLSRQHARLVLNFDSILIEDLGSSNGTFVGDQPVSERTRLFPNQSVRLGDVSLEVHRQRTDSSPEFSLAPAQKAIRRHLPPEILTDKRYAIGSIIARGGMGAILDARQNATKRTVAMKVMLDTNDEADVLRFIGEAQVTAQLDHPNIVPIYELGLDEQDQLFYTMKMVKGFTLKKVLELLAAGTEATVKKFPLPVLLSVFQKVCDAVAFAHSKGVIHRDLKPENIMLGDFGSVLVMDWGLAKVLRNAGNPARETTPAADLTRSLVASARDAEPALGSTLDGTIMGTPQYMAPEQARGEVETLDQRADIYALGAILYHLLALRPAVTGKDAWEIVGKVGRGEIEPLDSPRSSKAAKEMQGTRGTAGNGSLQPPGALAKRPSLPIPDSLAAVVHKAMALDPAVRYARTEDLQADILAYQNGFATSAEKAGLGKQILLAVKRHKAASIGLAAVLLIGGTLGTKAFVEGRRAARALADLKKSAPSMLALAESEAVAQHFENALEKTDVALGLDPGLLPAYWRRAWGLVALGRFSDAATALRVASERDPAHARQFDEILAQIEKIAAVAGEAERYAPDLLTPVFEFLETHDARGEAGALIQHLRLSNARRFAIARERLKALGGTDAGLIQQPSGLIELNFVNAKLKSLEQVRGIPCDILNAGDAKIESLEPLRGLHLTKLLLGGALVTDLTPLHGMALMELQLNSNPALSDLSPLAGMTLRKLNLFMCSGVADVSPLHGMPLEDLNLERSSVSDLGPLAGLPLQYFSISGSSALYDLSPLAGLPLKVLKIGHPNLKDLTPLLRIRTLERLDIGGPPDVLAQLRRHPKLAFINYQNKGYRPVAEFWADYDAQQAKK